MPEIKLLPSLKKRIVLMGLIFALGALVVFLARFPGPAFILYFGICLAAFIYLFIRLFNRQPLLELSDAGLLSRMTVNGTRIGLVNWQDITEIRDTRALWLIRGIELHGEEAVATMYQSRLDKKDRMHKRKTFILHLTSEEINLSHADLLALVNKSWHLYHPKR